MPNGFVHIELSTDDVSKARKFYKGLFKWKLEDMKTPDGKYTMIMPGPRLVGGGMQAKQMPDAPTGWLPYVEVDDLKKSIAKAKKMGADIVVEFQPIPGMGAFGIFKDPTGAMLGIWEGEKKKKRSARRAK
jgi:uncharacterized protein